jgi:hypothetical protein
MKKAIFFLLIGLVCSIGLQAQTGTFSHTASNPTGAVVNTSVDTMTYTLSKGYQLVGIQTIITKVSGTVAGTSVLYASIDGVNYVSTGDTLTNTNVTTNSFLVTKATPYKYWRILTTGSGTMSATTNAKIIIGSSPQ